MSERTPHLLRSLLSSRYRFAILLWALVVNMLLAPVLTTSPILRSPLFGGVLSLVSFVAVLLAAVLALSRRRLTTIVGLALAAAAVIAAVLNYVTESRASQVANHILEIAFLFFLIALLLRHVFATSRVTMDLIKAALCAYLVIGLMCAAQYAAIEAIWPGSFQLPDDGASFATPGFNVDEAVLRIYFSFVTLLTLGYGDVYPIGAVARIATVVEAFAGQIVLVVLVARLVGVHVAQSFAGAEPEDSGES